MPDQADHHVARALACLRQSLWPQADAEARAALALRSNQPDAIHVLGIVAWRTGRLEDAAKLIGATISLAPGYAEAYKNLGIVLLGLGQRENAIAAFHRAAELQPSLVDAHYHLATLLREKGDLDAAIAAYHRVLALAPGHADAHNDLGAALKEKGKLRDATASFRQALALAPDHVLALVNLGGALMDGGEPAAARELFRRARELAPERADARFGYCLSFIPIAYATDAEIAESRSAYARELAALTAHYQAAAQSELAAAAASAGQHLPFYLAYQGEDDRALQSEFGDLMARVMAAGHPALAARPPMPPVASGEPIRVGVVSAFFRSHSVWKLFGGWVRRMDRTRFKLYGYSTSGYRDDETPRATAAFDAFTGPQPFAELAQTIRDHALHVLLFPEIGMDQTTARLAALRLAPIQAAAWGHPETSGLPTIDYVLSSELMEPEGAERFYRETLVRLPNLSIDYAPLKIAAAAPDLAAAGVRADAVKYLCCQSLYKYLPRNDDVFARIAVDVPAAQFIFIHHPSSPQVTELLRRRLTAAFAAAGLDANQHVVFIQPQDTARYAGLNAACDVYLDSLEWSGGNTTLEAVAAGLPIVTTPGPLMRGRHSAAILTMMGMADLVARDKADYVALAVRLGRDAALRRMTADRVVATRSRLYDDQAPVRALEAHIVDWISRG
jgi:protein O-GlcNAc transferase